jgi:1,4-dihydroxy-2-naphthoate octaprenyltransferase
MLSWFSIPPAVGQVRALFRSEGRVLNEVLAGTGRVMVLHGTLFSLGMHIPIFSAL